jgi:hypothetical protein
MHVRLQSRSLNTLSTDCEWMTLTMGHRNYIRLADFSLIMARPRSALHRGGFVPEIELH